jgi:hypothetical protein
MYFMFYFRVEYCKVGCIEHTEKIYIPLVAHCRAVSYNSPHGSELNTSL